MENPMTKKKHTHSESLFLARSLSGMKTNDDQATLNCDRFLFMGFIIYLFSFIPLFISIECGSSFVV